MFARMIKSVFTLLALLSGCLARVLYEDPNALELHPRTFYLNSYEEADIINKYICKGNKCPVFSVIQDHPYYIQERQLRKSTFIFTPSRMACRFNSSYPEDLNRIYGYLNGSNERDKVMRNSSPVLVKFDHYKTIVSSSPWCSLSYSVGAYIPHTLGMPPKPLESSLFFSEIPENFQVYVHTFTGDVATRLLAELEIFRKQLDDMGYCYKSQRFWYATYKENNPRMKRRQEIWVEACARKSDKSSNMKNLTKAVK